VAISVVSHDVFTVANEYDLRSANITGLIVAVSCIIYSSLFSPLMASPPRLSHGIPFVQVVAVWMVIAMFVVLAFREGIEEDPAPAPGKVEKED
jgi:hypothetical protein